MKIKLSLTKLMSVVLLSCLSCTAFADKYYSVRVFKPISDFSIDIPITDPSNWKPQNINVKLSNLVSLLKSICTLRKPKKPTQTYLEACAVRHLIPRYIALEKVITNQEQFNLIFNSDIDLKQILLVDFDYKLAIPSESSPFLLLAEYYFLRKTIYKALDAVAELVNALYTFNDIRTRKFDPSVFSEFKVYFSSGSTIGKLAAYLQGLNCSKRKIDIEKCQERESLLTKLLRNIKYTVDLDHQLRFENPEELLTEAPLAFKVRQTWNTVRIEFIQAINETSIPSAQTFASYIRGELKIQEIQFLESRLEEILFLFPAGSNGFGNISFARAIYDYHEYIEVLKTFTPLETEIQPETLPMWDVVKGELMAAFYVIEMVYKDINNINLLGE